MHWYLNSTLSLGDNLAGSWDISRNLPIYWRRNWDKLIFSDHFQNADKEMASSIMSCDMIKDTNYQGSSQQGGICFLNQPVLYKPWTYCSIPYTGPWITNCSSPSPPNFQTFLRPWDVRNFEGRLPLSSLNKEIVYRKIKPTSQSKYPVLY